MSYVITEACVRVKDQSCMTVCPVDCIYDDLDRAFINPDECIECGLFEPVCPAGTIVIDRDIPPASPVGARR